VASDRTPDRDWFTPVPHGALIALRVIPNAGRDSIEAITTLADGRRVLKVRVTAQPEDGRANKAVIALLAATTGFAKSAFSVKTGATARSKSILLIAGRDAVETAKISILDRAKPI
jgi:uncharacterized protein